MRKVLFFVIIIFGLKDLNAQYKYKYKIEDSIKDCEPNGYGFDVIFKDGSVSEIAKLNVKY
jgi:hypothetical protein